MFPFPCVSTSTLVVDILTSSLHTLSNIKSFHHTSSSHHTGHPHTTIAIISIATDDHGNQIIKITNTQKPRWLVYMATYTKEILKEGTGPGIRVGQQVTVEVCIIVLS